LDEIPRPTPPSPGRTPLSHDGRPLRAIAIDIDGTITDMARRLDWDAVLALRAAEAAGIPVVLATGNVIPVTKTFGHSIGTTGPLVCENGGVIYWEIPDLNGHPGRVRVLKTVRHSRKDADQVIAELHRRGLEPRRITSDPWRESEAALENGSTSDEVVRRVLEEMGMDHLYVVSTGFACHILHKGMTKQAGVEDAVRWMNEHEPRFNPRHPEAPADATPLRLDEVLNIGDSPNDIPLFEGPGVAAVVANAHRELKEIADIVAERPHGAGVKEILARLGLQVPNHKGARTQLV
jgi:phosphoglycolate phosphatase